MENQRKKGLFNDLFVKNNMDLPFFLLLLLVLAVGLVMLLSSSYFYAFYNTDNNDAFHYFKRQLFFAVAGVFVMYVVSKLDYKYLKLRIKNVTNDEKMFIFFAKVMIKHGEAERDLM